MSEAQHTPHPDTALGFVHLSVHSEYSVVDGILRIGELVDAAARLDMPAVALTDRANLFGFIKFYQACLRAGVKPIAGSDLAVVDGDGEANRIIVLAMNLAGYRNLIDLVSLSYTRGDHRGCVLEAELFERGEDILVLSGGCGGAVGKALIAGDADAADLIAGRYLDRFGSRFYLELTRTHRANEDVYIERAVALAARRGIGVVATNDVCFSDGEDFEAHETRVCIHEGRPLNDPRRERRYSAEQYLKSPADMAAAFADLPVALANSVEIAKRCNLALDLGEYFLPSYPTPNDTPIDDYLVTVAREGLETRLAALGPDIDPEPYWERLRYELDVILQMGFAGYFLIVMEFIGWARGERIPVGPGRGSGAGSLVAWVLGITDLDPLAYDLLFERFLNPERVSMPDFDVDFCMEGRDRVIQHVSDLYGADAVSQIITFGTMAAKAVVRDVARVQGKPYGLADKLSKLIPFEVGMTLDKAVETSEELAEFIAGNDEVGEIMDMAYKLEGIVRNVGRHAGGVVIAPSQLTDFVPLFADDASGGLVSQYDKDDVETAGLVKFDFLGLKTLTIIDWAVDAINAAYPERALTLDSIPLDDAATYELLKGAATTGVFQLESRGMKDLIRRLLPDSIDDIIALVALFRPGPLQSGAVDDYIDRKHGRAPVAYPHPSLEESLNGTYGVVLYQEQVMQIAQVLAGFSLGQADLLRRAMGKKKAAEMEKVKSQFLEGTATNGVDAQLASEIFELMAKFAGYAFNKSHSATYAVVSFHTAWLKTHYPPFFMAATLSADMQNTDKVVTLIDEVRQMGLELRPPDVNTGEYRFSAHDGAVIYGLGAVKGVGAGPVEALVDERKERGPFRDLVDFCHRVDTRKANKRVIEALIRSGAMDQLAGCDDIDLGRAQLAASLDDALSEAQQAAHNEEIGMADLFGGVTDQLRPRRSGVEPWSKPERLAAEKDTLGLFLTGHPIDDYTYELEQFASARIKDARSQKHPQTIAGLVVSSRTLRNKRGETMSFIVVDDRSGRMEVSLFADVYADHRHKIDADALVIVEGDIQLDEFTGSLRMRARSVMSVDEARDRYARGVSIDLTNCVRAYNGQLTVRLREILTAHRADGCGKEVAIRCRSPGAEGSVTLGDAWRVTPCEQLLDELRGEFGSDVVRLSYR